MIKKFLLALVSAALALTGSAVAQPAPSSNGPFYGPNWQTGYVPTAAEWQRQWTNKLGYYVGGVPIVYGGTGATSAAAALANLGGMSNALAPGALFVGNPSGVAQARAVSGDCTMSGVGVITCTKTGGVAFGYFATGTDAANLSGTVANARLVNAGVTTVNGTPITLGGSYTITAAASSIAPGVTTITGGTANGLLWNSAGVLGNLASCNSGVIVTDGSGTPSCSTTLPSGLAMGTPASLTLTNATGLPTTGLTGTLQAAQFPALTGDLTTVAGALATTLATVNSNVGSFGDSTAIPNFTVNAKGLITAAGTSAVIAPAGTLSGTTLNSTVVNSSLTSVGTLTSLTVAGTVNFTGALTVTSPSASAFSVGLNGATNPAFSVDASTASQAAGLNVLGGTTSGAVAVRVQSSGTNNNLTIDAKGSGTFTINGTATGGITLGRATTITTGNLTLTNGNVNTGSGGQFVFGSRSTMQSAADGRMAMSTNGGASMTRLTFGAEAVGTPAVVFSGTTVKFRTGTDSADVPITASSGVFSSTLTATNISLTSTGSTINSGSFVKAINPMDSAYGALCDGSTNDSTAFTNAFAAGSVIQLPRGVTCIVGDLVLAAGKQFDCGGSMLQAVSGSAWVIKKNGVNTWIKNCYVNDPNDYNKKATTLTGAASAGATAVAVTATTGFANGMPVTIKLASGAYWPTKIKPATGISGLNVTVVDPIPSSATAVAVAGGGGTNCGVGTTMVVQGGSGPPVTLYVTGVSAGAVTGATISSPGFYSTAPSNPVTAVSGNNATCTATFNLTLAGASSGAEFSGGWGSLVVDQSSYGGLDNIVMPSCFGCIGYYSTSTSSSNPTTQENVSKVQINAARHFGVTVDAGVYVSFFKDILIYGNAHGTSNYGTVGFYRNYANPTNGSPSGGNHFSYTSLTFEIGTLSTYGNLDFYEDSNTNDTIRNYGFVCNGCYKNNWVGPAFNAFTGPNAYSGTGGLGVGTYFGKYTVTGGSAVPAIDNNLSSGVAGGANAADIYFSDWSGDGSGSGAAVWLGAAGPNMILSGQTAALQNASMFFSGNSGAEVGGTGSTWYLANGIGSSTTEYYVSSLVQKTGAITKFTCSSSVAPGVGNSYTCAFKDFPTPNAGSSTSRGSCTYTGAASFGCTYTGPGFYIADQDQVAIAVTSSASAPIANFKVYAAGF